MHVEQFKHVNQFHITDLYKHILQSYSSKVVEITNNPGCIQCIILGRDWDYSTTTSKHVYEFLDEFSKLYIPYNTTNKRKYINDLLKECKEDKRKFADEHNFTIYYDESMR